VASATTPVAPLSGAKEKVKDMSQLLNE
jgi:hypothetical protein